jgi:hypothetical protein
MGELSGQGMPGALDGVAGVVRGTTVYDAEGKKLGTVDEVHAGYLKLRKGLIFKKDLYVPAAAVSRLRGDEVHLMTREGEIDALGWDTPPSAAAGGPAGPWVTIRRVPHEAEVVPLLERVFSREALRVPVRAERVSVAKTPVITGEVAVTKAQGSERERVETTVRRLEVEVEGSGQLVRENLEPGAARRDDGGQ